MLSDRPYMYNGRPSHNEMQTLWWLIGVNIVCYVLTGGGDAVPAALMLWSWDGAFRFWQPVTYMFFHAGFTHILFNMYGLYLFGKLILPILGRVRFLILYFVSGIAGAALWLASNWGNPVPALGASGALFGVMMGVAMLRPNIEFFMMFIPVPLKARTLVIVYALLEIFSQWRGVGNIAHLAHLGGFLGGYLYLILFCKRDVIWSLGDLFKSGKAPHYYGDPNASARPERAPEASAPGPEPHVTHVSQQEVDRLLDKISQEGINSLSDFERAELQHFREQMMNRGR